MNNRLPSHWCVTPSELNRDDLIKFARMAKLEHGALLVKFSKRENDDLNWREEAEKFENDRDRLQMELDNLKSEYVKLEDLHRELKKIYYQLEETHKHSSNQVESNRLLLDENKRLLSENKQLQSEIEDLKFEVTRWKNSSDQLRVILETSRQDVDNLHDEVLKMLRQRDTLLKIMDKIME